MAKLYIPSQSPLVRAKRGFGAPNTPPIASVKANTAHPLWSRHSVLLLGKDVNAPLVIPGVVEPTRVGTNIAPYAGKLGVDMSTEKDGVKWSGADASPFRQQSFTVWMHVKFYPTPWGYNSFSMFEVFDVDWRFQLGTTTTSGNDPGDIRIKYYDSTFRYLNSNVQASDTEAIIHAVRRQGVGTELYINGVLVASNSLAGDIGYSAGRGASIGTDWTATTDDNAKMNLYAFGYSPEAWTESEILNHQRDIYALFEPANQSPFIVGPAEAPSPAPILDNIMPTLISSTAVTPQIDMDFP